MDDIIATQQEQDLNKQLELFQTFLEERLGVDEYIAERW